jgi:hypothetical protein
MPRVKKNQDLSPEIKPEKKAKTKTKTAVKKVAPKKKARPIVVDVIEDGETGGFFPEVSEIKRESTTHEEEIKISEIDQQKKFFSELKNEITEKKPLIFRNKSQHLLSKDEAEPKIRKSVNLYRRLVWRFIIFTVILLLIVFYFSFSKLNIIIFPKGEVINDSLLLKISPVATTSEDVDTDFREQIAGVVKEITVTEEKVFSSTGEEFVGEELYGKVKIINNSNKAQALVATTRILSPDNKLFRIKSPVNVPAGGEVTVDIYTEKPSEEMAIDATTFTIPGLWLGLQDKIYAKSSENFVYRQKVNRYIKASDIEQAMKEMNDLLLAKVKSSGPLASASDQVLYETLSPASFVASAKVGEAKENFTVTAKGNLVVVTFSKDQVAKLTAAKLTLLVPDDKELVDYNQNDINYTFDNYDSKTGIATIKASFTGTMILKNNTEIIDKKKLVNLNRQQLENYLKTFPEIKDYEFKFFPSFINRAPRLPERIQVEINGLNK